MKTIKKNKKDMFERNEDLNELNLLNEFQQYEYVNEEINMIEYNNEEINMTEYDIELIENDSEIEFNYLINSDDLDLKLQEEIESIEKNGYYVINEEEYKNFLKSTTLYYEKRYEDVEERKEYMLKLKEIQIEKDQLKLEMQSCETLLDVINNDLKIMKKMNEVNNNKFMVKYLVFGVFTSLMKPFLFFTENTESIIHTSDWFGLEEIKEVKEVNKYNWFLIATFVSSVMGLCYVNRKKSIDDKEFNNQINELKELKYKTEMQQIEYKRQLTKLDNDIELLVNNELLAIDYNDNEGNMYDVIVDIVNILD